MYKPSDEQVNKLVAKGLSKEAAINRCVENHTRLNTIRQDHTQDKYDKGKKVLKKVKEHWLTKDYNDDMIIADLIKTCGYGPSMAKKLLERWKNECI